VPTAVEHLPGGRPVCGILVTNPGVLSMTSDSRRGVRRHPGGRQAEKCAISEQVPAKWPPAHQYRRRARLPGRRPVRYRGLMDETDQAIETERVQIVAALRQVADRLEQLPRARLYDALPVAVSAVEDLARRRAPWLR